MEFSSLDHIGCWWVCLGLPGFQETSTWPANQQAHYQNPQAGWFPLELAGIPCTLVLAKKRFQYEFASILFAYMGIGYVIWKLGTATNPSKMFKLSKKLIMFWGFFQLATHPYFQASFKINKNSVFCPSHLHFPSDCAARCYCRAGRFQSKSPSGRAAPTTTVAWSSCGYRGFH